MLTKDILIYAFYVRTQYKRESGDTVCLTNQNLLPTPLRPLFANPVTFKSKTCSQNWLEIEVPPVSVSQLMSERLKSPTTIVGRQVSDKLDKCLEQVLK